MAIHKDLKIAYVIFELESYIGVYSISEENGALTEIGDFNQFINMNFL